ncbi:hypothetical protein YA0637_14680 [Pseudomonas syringae]|uniref:hypothetical protein n=1 Tax=Pseudomonas syringae TaxID=317 RepID=UPI0018E64446|nr:hypothetical protein [Pseudomonas syringae]MBI6672789.1 hypothetical protein [Pseudomonas syringae]
MLTKQGRFHYSGASLVPDARDTLLFIPFSVGACHATPHILHIKDSEFLRQHFVVERENCFIKLMSYKWLTETSEQSYKKPDM